MDSTQNGGKEGLLTAERAFNMDTTVLQQQLEVMRRFDQRYKDKEDEDEAAHQWHLVAMVMDRLFLTLFTIATVVVTLVILVPRHNYDDMIMD